MEKKLTSTTTTNSLFEGDCLDVLWRMSGKTVDLVYLDPPFFTQKDWGEFDDKWESRDEYIEYLRTRIIECRRVLRETGSLYLHCDPTASHYIKVMLDEEFGEEHFQNEIVWCYHGITPVTRRFKRKHDIIFFYSRGGGYKFNDKEIRVPYLSRPKEMKIGYGTDGYTLTGAELDAYISRGKIPADYWTDIPIIAYREYPTQKPTMLLKRIIAASTDPGDVVLDPFCGSGTTLVSAKRLGRRYIGIDMNKTALGIAERRLGLIPENLFDR